MYRGVDNRTGEIVAIKVWVMEPHNMLPLCFSLTFFSLRSIYNSQVTGLQSLLELKNEIAMQKLSPHPNIVRYTDTYSTSQQVCI